MKTEFVGWIKRSGSTIGRLVDPLRLIHSTIPDAR
jgi:hypothetical protein